MLKIAIINIKYYFLSISLSNFNIIIYIFYINLNKELSSLNLIYNL
jgi:hypothetical protein